MTTRRVAVVGAGPSGLAATKVLLEDGFEVTMFDRQKHLGGIWSPDSAYADLHAQLLKGFMEFSNLIDTEAKDYASWQHIHNYLKKYAEKFHLLERIRFQTKVVLVDKDDLTNDHLPWIVEVETADGCRQRFEFDFVVVASGLFSIPSMPTFRNQHKFAGSIVHTSKIKTHEQLENKRIAIIGGGKSAVDFASLAGKYARSCHMIFRRAHWLVPYVLLHGYLPSNYVFTRVFTVLFEPFPYAPRSTFFCWFHQHFASLTKRIFDTMANDILTRYASDLFQDKTFIPKVSLRNPENAIYLSNEFVQLNREGRIIRKLASVDEIIDGATIRLDTGELIEADMIVCATGFVERFPFLSEKLHRLIVSSGSKSTSDTEGDDLDLYRRIVPVGVPNIAFIGIAAPAVAFMFYELQSHWMSDYFLGRMKLPKTKEEMREEIRTTRHFIHQLFHRKSYYMQYYWLEPMEILLQDMGLSLYRTNNWISEYFGLYRSKRLATLHDERQARAQGKSTHHWYFGFRHTLVLLLIFILFIWFFC